MRRESLEDIKAVIHHLLVEAVPILEQAAGTGEA